MNNPQPKDYGWIDPNPALGEEGGWTIEGGEEAYEEAVQLWVQGEEPIATEQNEWYAKGFTLDFNGLRENVLNDYNELVKLLKDGVTPLADVTVDGYKLERLLTEMKRDIVLLCSLMTDDTPSLISKEDFEIEDFDIESLTA